MFQDGAALIGSSLEPVVTILAEDQSVVREFGEKGGMNAIRFAHRFEKAGTYYIRIADYRESGSGGNFYRFIVGSYPLVLSAYPLGVELGKTARDRSEGLQRSRENQRERRAAGIGRRLHSCCGRSIRSTTEARAGQRTRDGAFGWPIGSHSSDNQWPRRVA